MPIQNIATDFAGQVGVRPRTVKIKCDDSFATVTAANYLQSAESLGITFYPDDLFEISYGSNVTQLFTASISGSTITLVPNAGGVVLPVTTGNFAVFNGTTGQIDDAGYTPSSAVATKVVMTNSPVTPGVVPTFSDTTGSLTNTSIVGLNVLQAGIASPDTNANIVRYDVNVLFSDIASGSKTIIPGSLTKSYRILDIQLNSGGTNFSGGGGNRLGIISDGTTAYSIIPAATMQSLANAVWGSTAVAFPASAPINQPTAPGASLVFAYTGGTTNYTAGSLTISVTAIRVA